VGLVADLLDRIRDNQERILYLLKRNRQTATSRSTASPTNPKDSPAKRDQTGSVAAK
jgi:hypothetical protein